MIRLVCPICGHLVWAAVTKDGYKLGRHLNKNDYCELSEQILEDKEIEK